MAKKNIAQKAKAAVWPGDLGKPIPTRLYSNGKNLFATEQGSLLDFARTGTETWPVILDKLNRLADHYEIPRRGPSGWGFLLALRLAMDLHPGFQPKYEGPLAKVVGFTVNRGAGRPKGAATVLDFIDDDGLVVIVPFIKDLLPDAKGDRDVCRFMIQIHDQRLKGPRFKSECEKKVEALRRRLVRARAKFRQKSGSQT